MRKRVFIIIEDGLKNTVDAKVFGNGDSGIYIEASTLQEAVNLVPKGEELEVEERRNWKPDPKPTDADKCPLPIKCRTTADDEVAEYEATAAGSRFKTGIITAKNFMFNHKHACLKTSQVVYLANKHHNNLINGSFDIFAYAYRSGYRAGKKDSKKA